MKSKKVLPLIMLLFVALMFRGLKRQQNGCEQKQKADC